MSRIGKQPVIIPTGVDVKIDSNLVTVKGPHGELSRQFRPEVSITQEGNEVIVALAKKTQLARMLWGTTVSHIRNMVTGVTEKFEKRLIIEGVGFRAETQENKLVMQVGFSHPVEMDIPEGITVTVEKEKISISGINKEHIGAFAASVRSQKKPEPYKGKGIRYDTEIIRRKQGKKAVGSGG